MPNIEIHGLDKFKAEQIRKKVNVLLKGFPFSKDVVVTTFDAQTEVKDLDGKRQPFIRVITTGDKEGKEAIAALQTALNVDIEYLRIDAFLVRPRPNEPPFA